jgi:hypothetical protein
MHNIEVPYYLGIRSQVRHCMSEMMDGRLSLFHCAVNEGEDLVRAFDQRYERFRSLRCPCTISSV